MKKIFMPMQEAGAGHKMPALAVKYAIDDTYKNRYDVEVVDFLKELDEKTDKRMKETWDFALANPFWARFGYKFIETLYPFSATIMDWMYPKLKQNSPAYMKEKAPDIVFSTHFGSIRAVLHAKKKMGLTYKVIGYVTDPFDGHKLWAEKEVDYLLCASEIAKKQLIANGMAPEKVKVFQFPVDNKFFESKRTYEEIAAEYNINPAYKTIVATAGGQGISDISMYTEMMYKQGYKFNIIYVCGRNESLKNELETLSKSVESVTNLIPLGFVSNMNELLQISDFTIAKAGASTTFEALFTGNPIIFTHWATYSEKPNIDYCVDNKVGWYADNKKAFFDVIDAIENTNLLEVYQENLSKLHLESGSSAIADFVVSELENS